MEGEIPRKTILKQCFLFLDCRTLVLSLIFWSIFSPTSSFSVLKTKVFTSRLPYEHFGRQHTTLPLKIFAPRFSTIQLQVATMDKHISEHVDEISTLHLPDTPMRQKLTELQNHISAPVLVDSKWSDASDLLKRVVVDLAWSSSPKSVPLSEEQQREERIEAFPCPLPSNHTSALVYISQVMQNVKEYNEDLFKVIKYLPKKNGLNPMIAEIRQGIWPSIADDRALTVAYYSIERTLVELTLVTMTYRLLTLNYQSLFLAPLKAICEKVPVRERHTLLLIYTRGFFTPGHNLHASMSNGGIYEVIQKHLYQELQFKSEGGESYQASKVTYPFLEIPALWALHERSNAKNVYTGVQSFLHRIESVDSHGHIVKALRKWSIQFLTGSFVDTMHQREEEEIQQNPVALELFQTHKYFVNGSKKDRINWRKKVEELGRVVLLMAEFANDVKNTDEEVVAGINRIMFSTTFIGRLRPGTSARRNYELVATGPLGRTGKVDSEEFMEILDEGLAQMFNVSSEMIAESSFQRQMNALLTEWQQPHMLADYYQFHRKDKSVLPVYTRFLRSLLHLSNETFHDIRYSSEENVRHLQYIDENILEKWKDEDRFPGTADAESLFRMGEDTRSCMSIRQSCAHQNRALLGYLLQGNTRLLNVRSSEGKIAGRAVLRLLLRKDTKAPVLYLDQIYASGHVTEALHTKIKGMAKEASQILSIPVYQSGDSIQKEITRSQPGEVIELIEVDGISPWVYSDGAKDIIQGEGLQHRHEQKKELTLAILNVTQ